MALLQQNEPYGSFSNDDKMLTIFTLPFNEEKFDFRTEEFWGKIASLSERYSQDQQILKMNSNRGSKHFLHMNRTFFGLYNLLHDLKAVDKVDNSGKYLDSLPIFSSGIGECRPFFLLFHIFFQPLVLFPKQMKNTLLCPVTMTFFG